MGFGRILRFVATHCALALLILIPLHAATWPIIVDGKRVEAPWVALSNTPERLAVGDALFVRNEQHGLWLCVRDVEHLVFEDRLTAEARIYRVTPSGRQVVGYMVDYWRPASALEADRKWQEARKNGLGAEELVRLTNQNREAEDDAPRPTLSAEGPAVKEYWGVRTGWNEDRAAALAHVRRSETFVAIETGTDDKAPLPDFSGFRCLHVEWGRPQDQRFDAVFGPELVFLRLAIEANQPDKSVDATRIARATNLRFFASSFADLRNPEALGKLLHLRVLDLSWSQKLTQIDWAAELHELESINLHTTGVKSLAPLRDLPHLRRVVASQSPVAQLPAGGFAALREFELLDTALPDGQVRAFRETHPACRVRFEWRDALMTALKGVDRLVLRSGGTCHRQPAEETVLFETRDAAEIAAFLDLIEINEKQSNGICMCCGTPTFDFYAGERHLAMVGVQHGQALRWEWPADGRLTRSSRERFATWLEQRGAPESAKAARELAAQEKAQERVKSRFLGTLGPELQAKLEEGALKSDGDLKLVIQRATPSPQERARLVLRLLGSDPEMGWRGSGPADELIGDFVWKIPTGTAAAALAATSSSEDVRETSGAARALFGHGAPKALLKHKALKPAILPLARWAAASSRSDVRSRTVRALEENDTTTNRAVLRSLVINPPPLREIAAEDLQEPGGMIAYRPGDGDVAETVPVDWHALLALVRLKDVMAPQLLEQKRVNLPAVCATLLQRIDVLRREPARIADDRRFGEDKTLGKPESE